MISRRDAIGSLAVFANALAAAGHLHAQGTPTPAAPPARRPPVFTHDLPNVDLNGWQVTVSWVDMPPGRVGAAHHHAGFVLAYVLEGTVITKVSGQEERAYHVGEMFYEPPGSTHEVSKNASATDPARLLAMIFAPKGAQLTTAGPAQRPGVE